MSRNEKTNRVCKICKKPIYKSVSWQQYFTCNETCQRKYYNQIKENVFIDEHHLSQPILKELENIEEMNRSGYEII